LTIRATGVDGIDMTDGSTGATSMGPVGGTLVTSTATSSSFGAKVVMTSNSEFSTAGGAEAISGVSSLVATSSIDVSTAFSSQDAISTIDAALSQIDNSRAGLGAVQNRFGHTISNLANIQENVSASRSRIQDTDFATETAEMTKNQILQQAGTSILSQANQIPQAAISLLGG
ncbi:flagellin, partial [Pseudoalteromonas atlantica]